MIRQYSMEGQQKRKKQIGKNSLYFKIRKGKRPIGDSGYAGEPEKNSIALPGHSSETKKIFARIKSRHETVNTRFKFFNILGRQ